MDDDAWRNPFMLASRLKCKSGSETFRKKGLSQQLRKVFGLPFAVLAAWNVLAFAVVFALPPPPGYSTPAHVLKRVDVESGA